MVLAAPDPSRTVPPGALPHSEESERAVLAALLIDGRRHLPTASARLRTADFHLERHRLIFQAMIDLQDSGAGVDLRTVQARLEQQNQLDAAGGIAYLAALDVDLPDLLRVESYVEIIKERSLRRRLMRATAETFRACLDGGLEARDALAEVERRVLELGEEAITRGFVALPEIFRDTVSDLEQRPQNPFPGLRTGFIDLDELTGGLHPGQLIILAGRPGMGKTSLALNVAQNASVRGGAVVGVFSLEMSQRELALRLLCSESQVPFTRLRSGHVSQREWEKLRATVADVSRARLFIDDSASATLLEVGSKARRLRLEQGQLDLIVVDYLQLMQAGGRFENRNLEIGAITRGLKQLAKELSIPVLCLSQLSRQPERRGSDHRPQLADLRESGAIEQDADIVAFVYRDEVYNRDALDNKGLAELLVAKHRSGETGRLDLVFIADHTTFRNAARSAGPPAGFPNGAQADSGPDDGPRDLLDF